MAITRVDEVLGKALPEDPSAIPRWDLERPDGSNLGEDIRLVLKNPVITPGMRQNKNAWDECLAASGVTTGTSSALALAQPGFVLRDGAVVRFKTHIEVTGTPRLSVEGTASLLLVSSKLEGIRWTIPSGVWVTAICSSAHNAWVIQGESGVPASDYVDAQGSTSGTATALTLSTHGRAFGLYDGAIIRFKLHVDSGATPTINVNGTGAKKLMIDKYKPMKAGTAAGTWLTAIYSSTFGFFVLQGSGVQEASMPFPYLYLMNLNVVRGADGRMLLWQE